MGIGSVRCPDCGLSFNWWQRTLGEYKRHLSNCLQRQARMQEAYRATGCRGCPAGCYERNHQDAPEDKTKDKFN